MPTMNADNNPFKGKAPEAPPAMTVLHRLTKPSGRWVEIRERNVRQFAAFEFLVFVDGSLFESRMFHGPRTAEYPAAVAATVKHYADDGWTAESASGARAPGPLGR